MLAEKLAQPGLQRRLPHDACHLAGDFKWATARGGEGDSRLMDLHRSLVLRKLGAGVIAEV